MLLMLLLEDDDGEATANHIVRPPAAIIAASVRIRFSVGLAESLSPRLFRRRAGWRARKTNSGVSAFGWLLDTHSLRSFTMEAVLTLFDAKDLVSWYTKGSLV